MSASAYCQRATGQRSDRVVGDEQLLEQIRSTHAANYFAYGYRRTWKALRQAGVDVGRDRVKRLVGAHGIQGAKRRGKLWRTTSADPAALRSPDLVNRDFTAAGPDRLWVADFTYLRCHEGPVFFAFGHRRLQPPDCGLAVRVARAHRSRSRRAADGPVAAPAGRRRRARPSLRCWVSTRTQAVAQVLDDHGVLGSIGSVGDAYDNALAESFVDSFKTELIADRVWRSRTQLELAIVEYVGWSNTVRLHEALDDRPPSEFEDEALSELQTRGRLRRHS